MHFATLQSVGFLSSLGGVSPLKRCDRNMDHGPISIVAGKHHFQSSLLDPLEHLLHFSLVCVCVCIHAVVN